MANSDLIRMTISELAPKIQAKEVSPVELTEAALEQVDRLQPVLNSFITILHDQARSQAREQEAALMRGEYRGPLHGIPIGIKDNLDTAGIRTTVGSKVLSAQVPAEDALAVARCKEAGAVILGKENLEEFAAGSTSNNLHYGAVHNPWDLGLHSRGFKRRRRRKRRVMRYIRVPGNGLGRIGQGAGQLLRRGGHEADLRTR